MKVTVFAVLKDYMPAEFELNNTSIADIQSLKKALIKQYPSAAAVIESCRFSTETEIISEEQSLQFYEHLFVIPPSSGG